MEKNIYKKDTMYLKTTEDCNMRCPFCYVPRKPIYMTEETAYNAINKYDPNFIIFHGGEPLLNPDVILKVMEKYPDKKYSMTSNMVIPIDEKRLEILKKLNYSIATSYSIDRFHNPKEYEKFKNNIKLLKNFTLLVTISKGQLKQKPEKLMEIINELNPEYVDLERVSIPDIQEDELTIYQWIDNYMCKMFDLLPKEKNMLYIRMKNAIKYNIYTYNTKCTDSIITINADGTTVSCPNSCVSANKEKRSPVCFTCDIFQYCGGDCETFYGYCKFPKKTFLKVKDGQDT